MRPFELTSGAGLAALNDVLSQQARIGLDTEFMRESTYFPQLCLVQIATADRIWCADPLEDGELDNFWRTLVKPEWIVHSGRQDVEVLFLSAGRMPERLFDTQLAAALLGYAPQLGYGALVSELFGVELPKSHTRADWSRRPLRNEFLQYAAEDVEYLLEAHDRLAGRLAEKGRLHWAEQDSADLLDPSLYTADPAAAVQRLKGARYLSGRARRAAERLAAWREKEALRLDRPRQWILRDSVLLEIAITGPEGSAALARTTDLPAKTVRRAGDELLAILEAARAGSLDGADENLAPARLDDSDKKRLNPMQAIVAATAKDLGLVPEVLASRKELTAALHGERDLRVFRGWRRELAGEKLLDLLDSD